MPDDVHRHRRLIAYRSAIPADHARFHVRGMRRERISFPHSGRKASVGVGSVR